LNNLTYILIGLIILVVIIDFLIRKRKKKNSINNGLENVEDGDNPKPKRKLSIKKIILYSSIIITLFTSIFLLIPSEYFFKIIYGGIHERETVLNEGKLYYKHNMELVNENVYCDQGNMGLFENGLKEGVHYTWYWTGTRYGRDIINNSIIKRYLLHVGNYKNGEIHGLFEEYNSNGNLTYKGKYLNGKEDGLHISWYSNEQIKFKGEFIKGKENGIHREWHSNGQLLYEDNFINGEKDGIHREWYSNGQLSNEGNFINGEKDGLHRKWYKNGQLEKEGNYINGEKDGLHREWNDDGQLISEGEFVNDKRDGIHREWNKGGQLKYKGNYKDGRLHGKKETWDNNGIKKTLIYENGYSEGALEAITELLNYNNKHLVKSKLKEDVSFLNTAYIRFINRGYNGTLDDFKILMGIK